MFLPCAIINFVSRVRLNFNVKISRNFRKISFSEMAEKTWTQEIIESPVNLALLAASGYLIYKIICDLTYKEEPYVPPPKLVKDMTLKVGPH